VTNLDDILNQLTSPPPLPARMEDGATETHESFVRRVVAAALLEGVRFGSSLLHSQLMVVYAPHDHVHEPAREAADERPRSEDQARMIFACVNELGFGREDREGRLAFVNAVLDEAGPVDSTNDLTVSQAQHVISVLVTLPAVIEAQQAREARRRAPQGQQ
jgi:hypothetical protein